MSGGIAFDIISNRSAAEYSGITTPPSLPGDWRRVARAAVGSQIG